MEAKEIKEKVFDGHIHFSAIVEMVGKPKEHVEKTLKDYLKTIDEQKDIQLISEDFSEAKPVEGEMFSAFVEVEILAKGVDKVANFCFDYMPSSIEIIDPESIKYRSSDFTDFLNDLQSRLHDLDMTVKTVNETNKQLNANVENLLLNSIKLAIRSGQDTIEKISKSLGILPDNLKEIMRLAAESGVLQQNGDKFTINSRK